MFEEMNETTMENVTEETTNPEVEVEETHVEDVALPESVESDDGVNTAGLIAVGAIVGFAVVGVGITAYNAYKLGKKGYKKIKKGVSDFRKNGFRRRAPNEPIDLNEDEYTEVEDPGVEETENEVTEEK